MPSRASVDDIWREIQNRALADFNKREAAKRLGHWPTDQEAFHYFMETPHGYKDVLDFLGVKQHGINEFEEELCQR